MAADKGLTPEELEAEGAAALPDKEVMSVLNLNTDANVGLDAAAPIDLGAGANINGAVPIDAGASANVLSHGGGSEASVDQSGAEVHQGIDGNAHAESNQTSGINQNDPALSGSSAGAAGETPPASAGAAADPASSTDTASPTDTSQLLDGNLLNVNTNVDLDGHVAAPISGAVAANANVAAPINAGVAANIGSVDSTAVADAHQDPIIDQNITGDAGATVNQGSDIAQGGSTT